MDIRLSLSQPKGKLGILVPGMGAVASTFIAGCYAVRKGLGLPVGSLTQLGRIEMHEGQKEEQAPFIREAIPLQGIEDLVFGGWDVYPDSMYEVTKSAQVLERDIIEALRPELEAIVPMSAVFEQKFVKNLKPVNVKTYATKWEAAEQLREDIRNFRKANGLERVVMVWCGSTEVHIDPAQVPQTLTEFEAGLKSNHPFISPSMIYTYAALKEKVPYANGAPNLSADLPALLELAEKEGVATSGKDFKTGQTLMKTIVAPGLKSRLLGLSGWFSTNILGNRDGQVLDDPASFKSKEGSKLSVLDTILKPEVYPDLYKSYYHKVRIDYYPPRGDDKEGWDNLDIFGWLGYPMQIKINFLCKDSILAAPLVLDLALFMDFAQRAGQSGTQEWLSFYYKSPTTKSGRPEHDLTIQLRTLKAKLRQLAAVQDVVLV